MTLEWILREQGIDPEEDVTIDTSISFSAMSGSFISGIGDFVSLFDLNATKKSIIYSFYSIKLLFLVMHNLVFDNLVPV